MIGILDPLAPSPSDLLLLRSALWEEERAREAWDSWLDEFGATAEIVFGGTLDEYRQWQTHLYSSFRTWSSGPPQELRYLKVAYARDAMRYENWLDVCGEILALLNGCDVEYVLHSGAALAETVYPDPLARHTHDIEVIVDPGEVSRVARRLVEAGLRARGSLAKTEWARLGQTFDHPSQLPLVVTTSTFRAPYFARGITEIFANSRRHEIAGQDTSVMGLTEHLALTANRMLLSGRRKMLRWTCDVWHIAAGMRDEDWLELCTRLSGAPSALTVGIVLQEVADSLRAPIPADVLEWCRHQQSKALGSTWDFLFHSAYRGFEWQLLRRFMQSSLQGRRRAVGWLLHPSGPYREWIRALHPVRPPET